MAAMRQPAPSPLLHALIFDLDGVLTDTAELHYRTWQRLADDQGWYFDRAINERLRGVKRRNSLEIILAENQRTASEADIAAWLQRKDQYFQVLLTEISPADLLPGAGELLHALRAAGIRTALGSASVNARQVVQRLGIADLLDVLADGNTVLHSKPAPDLFLWIAHKLKITPANCAVFEDAAAGIDAALAAGMWAIGLGPQERVGHAHLRFASLAEVTLPRLLAQLTGIAGAAS